MSDPDLERRKQELIREIHAAFDGVSREGGKSWVDSIAVDLYWTEDVKRESGLADTDTCWQDLIDDESWCDAFGTGGFAFLDAVGFRYYVAPAMIRDLRRGESESLHFALGCPPLHAKGRKSTLQKWSLLSDAQRLCIAAFVRFAIDRAFAKDEDYQLDDYEKAWDNYWKSVAEATPGSS
ncbi:MAG: hypothetical protein K2Y21_00595 [Phycisphaerales bacterium]|nr:hypothetical protein [Phycisphaerales bacterium]